MIHAKEFVGGFTAARALPTVVHDGFESSFVVPVLATALVVFRVLDPVRHAVVLSGYGRHVLAMVLTHPRTLPWPVRLCLLFGKARPAAGVPYPLGHPNVNAQVEQGVVRGASALLESTRPPAELATKVEVDAHLGGLLVRDLSTHTLREVTADVAQVGGRVLDRLGDDRAGLLAVLVHPPGGECRFEGGRFQIDYGVCH